MRKAVCIGIISGSVLMTPAWSTFGSGLRMIAQAEITQTAAVQRRAAPIGTTVSCTVDVEGIGPSEYGQHALGDVKITVLEVVRGNKAWKMIEAADASNQPPESGFEYLLVRIRFEYSMQGSQGNMPYPLKHGCLKLYSADNTDYTIPSITSPKPELIGQDLYSGSSHEGWVPFMAAINDNPILFYTAGSVWFRL